MEEYAIVYKEEEYSKFKKLLGNRDVITSRKNKILKSIQEVGYVLNPIIVNTKMEIIDGQGRFEALKELNLPIFYVIDENAGIEECRALNLGQTNWNTEAWIKYYAETGNKNYVRLTKLMNDNDKKAYTPAVIVGILNNTIVTRGFITNIIKEGELIITEADYNRVQGTIEEMSEIEDVISNIKGSSRVVITSIAWILNNTKVNKKRLFNVLSLKYALFRPVVEEDVYLFLEDISDYYNKKISAQKCIDFDSEYKLYQRNN